MDDIKLIVADLDNTLLTPQKEVSPYTAEVLHRCRALGILFGFATARAERVVARFLSAVQPDFIISNNGATITKGGVSLYTAEIPRPMAVSLLARFRTCSQIKTIGMEAQHCIYINYSGPPWEEGWNPVYCDFSTIPPEATVKLTTQCSEVAAVREILEEYPRLHLYENTGEDLQQMMLRDATKLNAIRHICSVLDIPLDNVAAFGDDYNDVDMLAHCGHGVAVSNANQAAKKAARYICGGNDEDGVAHWLARYVLNEAPGGKVTAGSADTGPTA